MLYFFCSLGWAQTDVNVLLNEISEKHKDMQSLEADFTQITKSDAFPEPIEQSGRLYAMRPKLIRWDFQTPMVQSYYTDGKSITLWNEMNNQVLISSNMSEANEAFDVLTDFSSISKKYNVKIKEESAEGYVLSVLPKPEQQFQKLEITMSKAELWITKFVVESEDAGTVELSFSNIKRNSLQDQSMFQFVPPEGAEIIRAQE